jgi:hypothetical protein
MNRHFGKHPNIFNGCIFTVDAICKHMHSCRDFLIRAKPHMEPATFHMRVKCRALASQALTMPTNKLWPVRYLLRKRCGGYVGTSASSLSWVRRG